MATSVPGNRHPSRRTAIVTWSDIRHPRSRIHSAEDARALARRRLPRLVFDFIDGATGRERACARNLAAMDGVILPPRVLQPVARRSLATRIMGHDFALPFGIAPMGMCNLVWPGADAMLARAATLFEMPLCLSTAASTPMEQVRDWSGGRTWFQLYVTGTPEQALALIDRAEAAGYDTLVLTVDVPVVANRVRDRRNGFAMPFALGPAQVLDFALHPRWSLATLAAGAPRPVHFDKGFDRAASRAGLDWALLDRIRARWNGNLVVKGVMNAEDALRIRAAGADAIEVSNHGGRQLDAAPAAITALPAIRAALGPDFPILFDSGIRSGEDIARALALGADFVMLGRPLLFAIGAEGESGLVAMLRLLAEELDIALAQLGLTSPAQLAAAATIAPSLAAVKQKVTGGT